ncbi:hypothetical protein BUALT_Bualt05G0051600 [Buddleja alternifolia]|uniref:Uncharacterized protein n=1 Tax=Buddleja alternifolia TaxID=168488 RepID=A0AAV6XGN9_9LAMI|nr:hypothetical protein BUALT_Bualt05G0051600 [Buddleja alternifolia]
MSGIVVQGLEEGDFADSLVGEPANNLDELLRPADKYVLIEESRYAKMKWQESKEANRCQKKISSPKEGETSLQKESRITIGPKVTTGDLTTGIQTTIGKLHISLVTIMLRTRNQEQHASFKLMMVRTGNIITFDDSGLQGLSLPHEDAMVISATIANIEVKVILIDSVSAMDVMFFHTFKEMQIDSSHLVPLNIPLVGFSGEMVHTKCETSLPLSLGTKPQRRTHMMKFLVVDSPDSAYNIILGRSTLNTLQAIVSSLHRKMKFPTCKEQGKKRKPNLSPRMSL